MISKSTIDFSLHLLHTSYFALYLTWASYFWRRRLFTHLSAIDKARKTETIQTMEDLFCTDQSLLRLFLSLKRSSVRTLVLAWLRKADERARQCHYAWSNKGNRGQQKVLKTILNAHFINKAMNVPLWSMTSGVSSTKENNKFRSFVTLVKLCQNPSICL